MKGDKLVLQDYHKRVASEIVSHIIEDIRKKKTRYLAVVNRKLEKQSQTNWKNSESYLSCLDRMIILSSLLNRMI
jgi:hypothetical protein